jgi:O-glycosyl hydrolase
MYAFAQYSRYIRPDAYRVDITESHLLSTAYVNKDGSTVVVILNPTHEATDVSIDLSQSGWIESVHAYVTDQNHEMDEVETSWENGVVTAHLPARGLITFKAA